jgi:thioredoxin reductase (NADPH)
MEIFDLIIVGAGPAGLSAGIYAQERKLKTKILEANTAGGQPITLYPEKYIYDYPGFLKITGKELMQKMIEQVLSLGCMICEDSPVLNIIKDKQNFLIEESRNKFISKSVILATGFGNYSPKHIGFAGEEKFQDKGIFYQKLTNPLIRKRVVVVGGGDTALENCVAASEKGAFVTLIHRNQKFRAVEQTVVKAKSLGVKMYLNSVITKINGDNYLENIEIENDHHEKTIISTDYLVICIGAEINTDFISKLGLKIEAQAIVVNSDMETSIPGIFACGDIISPLGSFKRLTMATSAAAISINGVYKYLKHPYWSKS